MLPKQRTAKARKRKRRAHHAMKPISYGICPITGSPKLHHRAAPESGFVRPGLQVKTRESE